MTEPARVKPHHEARVGLASTFRPALDDRGRRIRRLDRRDLVRAARSEHPGLRMLAQRLKHAAKAETRRTTPDRLALSIALVFGAMMINGLAIAFVFPLLGVGGPWFVILSFAGLIAASHRVIAAYVARGALAQIARTAVAEGVCGSCAFPLQGAPGEGGLVTCPECGAAWRSERIVAAFWENPTAPVLRTGLRPALAPGVRSVTNLYAPDDRGRYVQTPDARLARVRPDLLSSVPPEEQRSIRRSMRRIGRWWRVGFMVGLSWMPGLALWGAWEMYLDGEWMVMGFLLALGMMIGIPVLMIPLSSGFCPPHRTARVIVRHGRCGSCLRPLADAAPDDAGRRVCAGCGSAWLVGNRPTASPTD